MPPKEACQVAKLAQENNWVRHAGERSKRQRLMVRSHPANYSLVEMGR